jgi:hypothetical protein
MKNFKSFNELIDFIKNSKISDILEKNDDNEYIIKDEHIIGGSHGYCCFHSCDENCEDGYHDVEAEVATFENIKSFLSLIFEDKEFDDEFDNVLNHFISEYDYDGNSDYYGNYYNYNVNTLKVEEYYNSRLSLKQMRLKKLNNIGIEE